MAEVTAEPASVRERTLRYFLLALLAILAVVMVSLTLNGRFTSPGDSSGASLKGEVTTVVNE